MPLRIILSIIITLSFFSCSKNENVYVPSKKENPYKIYSEGLDAFKKNDFFFASKKFSKAELNFSEPRNAAKSAIMASFSLYGINFYTEAEKNLKRYLKTYPGDKNVIYAQYLLAIIYFEQIADEKKDLKPIIKSKDQIDFFLKNYPNTEYALDLKFKKDLLINQLAAKELYIAKFYISVQKWIPAISRLKRIIEDYETTIFVEEAIHRLVEINYYLGLEDEAKKYAALLGYNYNSSEWYEQSYKILNKNYEKDVSLITKKNKKDKKIFIEKIKEIFK